MVIDPFLMDLNRLKKAFHKDQWSKDQTWCAIFAQGSVCVLC